MILGDKDNRAGNRARALQSENESEKEEFRMQRGFWF
jgi:hypothetical protein